MDKAIKFASRNNLDFTLVTPYVTNIGLKKVKALLKELITRKLECEVVFNDWGILKVINEKYGELTPLMGRLLNKNPREPRIMNIIDQLPESALDYCKSTNLTTPHMCTFLKNSRIRRVELDNPLHGIKIEFDDPEIKASLHVPYVYVTTTRLCLANACDISGKEYIVQISPCLKECQKYSFNLSNSIMPVTLIRKGNTIFYQNAKIPEDINEENLDRIVFSPEIPI